MTTEHQLQACPPHEDLGASDLDSGDTGGEEALRRSAGGPTAHSNLYTGDRRVHLSVREEEEDLHPSYPCSHGGDLGLCAPGSLQAGGSAEQGLQTVHIGGLMIGR